MDVGRGLIHPHYVLEFMKVLFLKEHVRGPVRECQTIVLDILREMRCEELKCTRLYTAIPSLVKRRNVEYTFGEKGRTQCDTLQGDLM